MRQSYWVFFTNMRKQGFRFLVVSISTHCPKSIFRYKIKANFFRFQKKNKNKLFKTYNHAHKRVIRFYSSSRYPYSLKYWASLRQSFRTLTHKSKNMRYPNKRSISVRASLPTCFNIVPCFPIRIPF